VRRLANVPNDTGHPWRLNKFVEYQNKVPPIHPITLCEYLTRRNLDKDECVILSWLISVTYSEVTAIFLFEEIDWWRMPDEKYLERFWEEHKPKLIFGSARKYAKSNNWFVPLMTSFLSIVGNEPYKWLLKFKDKDPVQAHENIMKVIKDIRYVGRFAADLFLEMIMHLSKRNIFDISVQEPEVIDWKNCSNLTSGTFNLLYMDEEADLFDKTGKIAKEHLPLLNKTIFEVQKEIQEKYPEQDSTIPLVITKLCSFRNLFKSSRYGGFHHDRQLENLIKYENNYPNHKHLWDLIYRIRRETFNHSLLGEIGGWTGIRKERKKLFLNEGLTGVEEIQEEENELGFLESKIMDLEERIWELEQKLARVDVNPGYKETTNFGTEIEPEPEPEPAPEPEPPKPKPEPEPKPKKQPKQQDDSDGKSFSQILAEQIAKEHEESVDDDEDDEESDLESFINSKLNDTYSDDEDDDEDSEYEDDDSENEDSDEGNDSEDDGEVTVKPTNREKTFAELMGEISDDDEEDGDGEEEEEVRKPIKAENKGNVFIADPYGGKRVDKTLGEQISKNTDVIDQVYFPLEPFHYREEKRHGTQYAIDACVEHKIPVSLETRRVVPDWAMEALSNDRQSEIRIHLNTMDKKKWKAMYPKKKAANPDELVQTFIDCYNSGVYTILKISPIVPGIITRKDVFEVVDKLKNWTPVIEICFASFTDEEFKELEKLIPDYFEEVSSYYRKVEDRWYAKDSYRESFLKTLNGFLDNSKIKLNILNEVKFDGEDVSVINFKE
jgi:hypothetical protein